MPTFHVSETEAATDFAALLARVRAGTEVVIESAQMPVAVLRALAPPRRTLAECIAMLPQNSANLTDENFAADIEAAIHTRREPLDTSAWD